MADTMHTVSSQTASPLTKIVAGVIVVLLVGIGGFIGGMSYQKGHSKSTTSTAANGFGGQNGGYGGSGGMRRSGGRGQVTAVSSTSITINDSRTSTTKTYAITSSTKITNNGATASASDIQTGDEVFVMTSSSTSTDATAILLNPTMGGFGGGAPTGQSTASPDSQSTTNQDTNSI